jgi:hypothetical protein
MVRTRATTSRTNNPPPELGGPSHQNAAEMEARMAQMSKDMEALTQQNLWLLEQLTNGQVLEEPEGHGEGESNTHEEEDRESRRAPERSQPKSQSRQAGGVKNPPPDVDVNPLLWGVLNPLLGERRLSEAIATLDDKYEEKFNQLQQEIQ